MKQLKQSFIDSLKDLYPLEEIKSFFILLAEKQLGLSRIDIALKPDIEISDAKKLEFENAITRLINFEPIQYIIGDTEFFGLQFLVNNNVLIPRPETEELVSWIIEDAKNKKVTLLDIGTGSGCIAITLAHQIPYAKISAIDISKDALKIARQNSLSNKVNVNFMEVDVLQYENSKELQRHKVSRFDVIVSNPPYVRALEKKLMQSNVLKHEPEIALFVEDEDPLLFYRRIAQLSKEYLKDEGILFFEINEYLGKEMKKMLEAEEFCEIEIRKDIFDKDRMIKCKKL